MKYIKLILLSILCVFTGNAQQTPADTQSKSIAIVGGTAHLGNGTVIQNSLITFESGILQTVSEYKGTEDLSDMEIIDSKEQHIYPGFIVPNSTLGLIEIDAVRASDDESELGTWNPHIRSLIAYNAESRVVESMRPNGVLLAQITPRGGRISGTSSIVQLDAWNWKDAVIKENDGIHLNFPPTMKRSGWWAEPGAMEANKEYLKKTEEISLFLDNSRAYIASSSEHNLIFQAMKGVFDGTQTLFIHAQEEKQIIDAVQLVKKFGIKKMVIVGGYDAYKTTDLLKENSVGVLLRNVHDMPNSGDEDVDLPFKMARILVNKGILVGLENSGDKERMQTRNLPFLAGTCAAYGLDKEQALQLITSNTAKILGIDDFCGTLEQGKDATLFISDGDALDMRTNQLTEIFIQGRKLNMETHQTKLNAKYKEKYNQK